MIAARQQSFYFTLRTRVVLVTVNLGRLVFTDSRDLFKALESVKGRGDTLLAVWEGDYHATEANVAALQTMLETVGLVPFKRLCRSRRGPESLTYSRWAWAYLSEYLGWSWHKV